MKLIESLKHILWENENLLSFNLPKRDKNKKEASDLSGAFLLNKLKQRFNFLIGGIILVGLVVDGEQVKEFSGYIQVDYSPTQIYPLFEK